MKNEALTLNNRKSVFLWVVFLIFGLYDLVYVLNIDHHVLVGDSWRYVRNFLLPYYDGSLGISDLYSDHHPSPLPALAFLLNAVLFNLNMNIELVLGALAKIVSAGLILLYFQNLSKHKSIISSFGILITLLTIYPMWSYHWSVLSFNNVFSLILLGHFLLLDTLLRNLGQFDFRNKYFLMSCVYSAMMIAVARDYAYIGIVSTSVFLLLLFILTRARSYFYCSLSQLIILFLGKLTFNFFGIAESSLVPDYLERILANMSNIVNTFTLSMLAGAVPLNLLEKTIGEVGTLIVSYLLVLFCMILTFIYLRNEHWKRTSLPVILIVYVFIFCLATIAFRYLPEPKLTVWGEVPARYIPIYSLGFVAFWWIFFELTTKSKRVWKVVGLSLVLVQANFLFRNDMDAWNKIPGVNQRHDRASLEVFKQGMNDIPRDRLPIFGGNYPNGPQLDLLRDEALNVFNEKLMSESIEEYIRSQ